MVNLYEYYAENEKEAFNAMKNNCLTELAFPTDIYKPSILICDCDGNVIEATTNGAKIVDDKLVLVIEDNDGYETDYSVAEIPYLSAQETFETIMYVINERLNNTITPVY